MPENEEKGRKVRIIAPEEPGGCWLCRKGPDEEDETNDMVPCSDCSRGFHRNCLKIPEGTPDSAILCPRCARKAKDTSDILEKTRIQSERLEAARLKNEQLQAELDRLNSSLASSSTRKEDSLSQETKEPRNVTPHVPILLPKNEEFEEEQEDQLTKVNLAQCLIKATETLDSIANKVQGGKSEMDRIHARDVGDSLCTYDGTSAKGWVRFISEFETSTAEFKFGTEYNMRRLKKKLLKDAGDLIKNYHDHKQLPEVLLLLKKEYGRSEKLRTELREEFKRDIATKCDKKLKFVSRCLDSYVQALKYLKLKEDLWDKDLMELIYKEIPYPPYRKWMEKWIARNTLREEKELLQLTDESVEIPKRLNLEDLQKFLSVAALTEDDCLLYRSPMSKNHTPKKDPPITVQVTKPVNSTATPKKKRDERKFGKKKEAAAAAPAVPKKRWDFTCAFCKQKYHPGEECPNILGIPVDRRWKIITDSNSCCNCLMGHHRVVTCRSTKKCEKCQMEHHTLLHRDTGSFTVPINSAPPKKEEHKESPPLVGLHSVEHTTIIYGQIPIKIENPENGLFEQGWAYLDMGSGVTLMDHGVYKKLRLRGTRRPLTKKWTNNVTLTDYESCVTSITVIGPNGVRHNLNGVRTNQGMELPGQQKSFNNEDYEHLKDLPKYDYTGEPPFLLISLEHLYLMLALEYRIGKQNEPMASRTPMGWVFMGTVGKSQEDKSPRPVLMMQPVDDHEENLHIQVARYFELENFGVIVPQTLRDSDEDEQAERIFDRTHRYIEVNGMPACSIGFPWKEGMVLPPWEETYLIALTRLQYLERKVLNREPHMKEYLIKLFKEYEAKGYIRELTPEEIARTNEKTYYVPTFYVNNPNKEVPKPRVVYDFSAASNGVSLNDCLLKGKDRIPSLMEKMGQFRIGKFAVCGDIQEMYHRIFMDEADVNSQRFLWRDFETSKPPRHFVLQVLAFGPTSAPSAAIYVKNKNAERMKDQYPRAFQSIITDYVDNSMESYHTLKEAIEVTNEIIAVNYEANFKTRDFISNSLEVVSNIHPDHVASVEKYHFTDEEKTEKLLGVQWDVKNDTFIFRFSDKVKELVKKGKMGKDVPTKREALSVISSIFDPMGWISHWTIQGRIIIQDIWRSGIKWDDPLQQIEAKKWYAFLEKLFQAHTIVIPRCYFPDAPHGVFELHTLCDASENAYAAVIYLECVKPEGLYKRPVLVAARSRVAPLKAMSVARLELQAAVLGTRLHSVVKQFLTKKGMDIVASTFYSDSEVVLGWINSDHRRYQVFVAHRVSEILTTTTKAQWCYVNTKDNTADEATKITDSDRWFIGPRFLDKTINEDYKVDKRQAVDVPAPTEEIRHVMVIQPAYETNWSIGDYSTWERALKHVAIYMRYVKYLKLSKAQRKKLCEEPITVSEMTRAEIALIRMAQMEDFREDYAVLSSGKQVQNGSSLLSLTPFFDPINRVIRSDSRIKMGVPYDQGHPYILPKNHRVTQLLVDYYHRKYLHIRPDTQHAKLRLKYHVISARSAILAAQARCQRCRNNRARVNPPQMAELPNERLQPYVKPFTHCGVDMFGPFKVNLTRNISTKRYGIIFTCFSTRAIHLELASRADTDSFMSCLFNMISRRGMISVLYSDQGTNFVGAETEIRRRCRDLHIEFRRNFPLSPHWGGTWESLIKSVKEVMKAMMETTPPTDLELNSFLIRAENMVNSRPLVEIPLEHKEDDFLTPNHFLLGVGGGEVDYIPYDDATATSRRRWVQIVHQTKRFWRLWIQRYLPTLSKRVKWQQEARPLAVGDVVVIVDETAPKKGWQKGRVVKLMGTRGKCPRAADIKIGNNKIITRPVTRLIVLDVRREAPEASAGPSQATGGSTGGRTTGPPNTNYGSGQNVASTSSWSSVPAASSTRVPVNQNLSKSKGSSKKDRHPPSSRSDSGSSNVSRRSVAIAQQPTLSQASTQSWPSSDPDSYDCLHWSSAESDIGGSHPNTTSVSVTGGSTQNTPKMSDSATQTERPTANSATQTRRTKADKLQQNQTYTVSTRRTDRSRPIPVHVCSHAEAIDAIRDMKIYSREPTPEPCESPLPIPDLPGFYEDRERRIREREERRLMNQPAGSSRSQPKGQQEKENKNYAKYHKKQEKREIKNWPKRSKKQLNFEEPNVQASRPTKYRSGISWSNYMLPILMFFMYILACVSGTMIQPVAESGFLMTRVSEAYAQTGRLKWSIETGMDVKKDKKALRDQLDQLDQACIRIKSLGGKTKCQEEAKDLRKMLEVSRVSTRRRRWEGILRQLWSVFLGSDDHMQEIEAMRERQKSLELHTKNTMTITAKTLIKSENATQAKMSKFVATLNQAIDRINELESHFGTPDARDLEEIGESLISAFMVHFTEMKAKYERFDNIRDILTLEEIEANLHLMRSRLLPETILPPLSTQVLIGLMETYIDFTTGPLTVDIYIPVVFHEKFDLVKIFPIPQPATGIVAAVNSQLICYNNVTATYFYVTDAHTIVQPTVNVTLIPNTAFKSAKQETDCLVCHLFQLKGLEHKKCDKFTNVLKDKPDFTQVLAMPQMNQFLIVTSEPQKVTIQCSQDYRTLTMKLGDKVSSNLVTLFAGCKIHTPFGFIMANSTVEIDTNLTTVYFSQLHIPASEYRKWNRTHKLHHVALDGPMSHQDLDVEIEHIGNMLDGENAGMNTTQILVISVPSVIGVIALAATLTAVFYYHHKRRAATSLPPKEPLKMSALAGSFKAKCRLPVRTKKEPQTFEIE